MIVDIASYADDTTIYTVKENKDSDFNTSEGHFSHGSVTTL